LLPLRLFASSPVYRLALPSESVVTERLALEKEKKVPTTTTTTIEYG
jgi:hypothetical protein